MLNGNIQHCKDNDAALDETQESSDSLLSKEEFSQLGRLRTQGISAAEIVVLNKLLADALSDNNFEVFFKELLLLLKAGRKEKIRWNCRFILYQNREGYSVILSDVQSVRALEDRALGSCVYVCDLGSLGLIFPGASHARDGFFRAVFSSAFNSQNSVITRLNLTYSTRNGVNYQPVDYNKTSLQYALEYGDLLAVKVICASLSKSKICNNELKKVSKCALSKIIEQQGNVSDDFLECVNCLLDFKTEDLDPRTDKPLQIKLEQFVDCIRTSHNLLPRICKASYENIVKIICYVELRRLDKTEDYEEENLLEFCRKHILAMDYGPDRDSIVSVLVQSDSVSLLEALFERYEINVNSVNSYGYSALHFAAAYNSKKCARFLLNKSNIVLSSAKSGLTPLHLAAGTQSLSVLKLLIRHNPNAVYEPDSMGRNIMHHAAMGGFIDNLLLCINIGMDVNVQAVVYDCNGDVDELRNAARGNTPLHLAIEEGKLGTASCLLSCKHIDLSIKNSEGYTPVQTVDHNGNTLLHQAALVGNLDLLLKVLQLGWQEVILKKNCKGKTAFEISVNQNNIACAAALFACLCDRFQCDSGIFKISDNYGNTLLHQAVAACRISLVKKILSYNVNVMSVNAYGETALDIAIKVGSVEIVGLLIADNRQALFSKSGGSYVMKLMNKNLLTKEIYKEIKKKVLKKERCCYAKLAISLIPTFMLITCAVVLCVIKFQDNLCDIFGVIVTAKYESVVIAGIAILILFMMLVSCSIIGGLCMKLAARDKLLCMKVSNTHSPSPLNRLDSVNSESSDYEYVSACMNEEQTSSESSTECENEMQMLPLSLRPEKYKTIKSKRLSNVSLLSVTNAASSTLASLQ